jgi:hypothetical protein
MPVQAGNVRFSRKMTFPTGGLFDRVAAEPAVHVQHYVLTIPARSCRSSPVNRDSVTSRNMPFPSAVSLLRLPFNARRDSLRHGIPFKIFRAVPSLSRFCCHLSPRYGILPPQPGVRIY